MSTIEGFWMTCPKCGDRLWVRGDDGGWITCDCVVSSKRIGLVPATREALLAWALEDGAAERMLGRHGVGILGHFKDLLRAALGVSEFDGLGLPNASERTALEGFDYGENHRGVGEVET